jgi:phosphatidylinositol alpha-1,6-mannosyltransferase
MRLLFVTRRYWPAVGGIENVLRHVARELAERHELTVLAHRIDDGPHERLSDSLDPPPTFEPFYDGSVHVAPLHLPLVRRVAMWPLLGLAVPGLRRYAYGRPRVPAADLYARVAAPCMAQAVPAADIVHMWAGDLMASAAVRVARLLAAKAVITPFAHPGQWGTDPASARAYRSADRIFALLRADAAVYRELGVAEDRLRICGVCSPGVARGGGTRLRAERGISGGLVLFLGVRRAYKGHELLRQAAERLAERRPDLTFAFVGPGPTIDAAAGAHVIDAGMVDEDARAAWLEAADLVCLPSAFEIFPNTVLEAWSAGTPVLLSDIPPLRELVEQSGGGAVVARDPEALADAIVRLIDDRARLERMGAAGRARWASEYTPVAVAAAHERFYADAVGRAPPGRPA